jgi:ParB-like chromosome segregation protein Spo0J
MATEKLENLRPAPWRTTHVLRPDLKLLSQSIEKYGIISPIVVQKSSGFIIDGFHRVVSIATSKRLKSMYGNKVPVHVVDCDDIEAMIMHISLNRARGSIVNHHLSRTVKKIHQSGKYTAAALEDVLGMSMIELDMLLDGSLIKMRKVSEHKYSKAWVPIEAPVGAVDSMEFERPPNADS